MPNISDDLIFLMTQTLLIIEEINWQSSRIKSAEQQGTGLQSLLLARKALLTRGSFGSPLSMWALRAGMNTTVDPESVDEIFSILLEPARIKPGSGPANTHISGKPRLQLAHEPVHLRQNVSLHRCFGLLSPFSHATRTCSVATLSEPPVKSAVTRLCYLPEIIDPFTAIEKIISKRLPSHTDLTYYYVQEWLKRTFDLSQDAELTYSLAQICGTLNEVFFSSPTTTIFDSAATRSPYVGVGLVLHLIDYILGIDHDKGQPRRSLGVFLSLRAGGFLRCGYQWKKEKSGEGGEDEAVAGSETVEKWVTKNVRPFRHSRLLSFLFGTALGIQGLRDVLQGGLILPPHRGHVLVIQGKAGAGKTVFALSMMTDVARKGGLAIYFSFEETYDSILDHLISFDLLSPQDFSVEFWNGDAATMPHKDVSADRIGRLLLVQKNVEFSLITALREIAAISSPWENRAVAIDSLNALESARPNRHHTDDIRVALRELVDTIDASNLLGVLITEAGELGELAYLGDTIVELKGDSRRQVEILKCRRQNFFGGRHLYQIIDGHGITIWLNLSGVRTEVRDRLPQAASTSRVISITTPTESPLTLAERSATLISGSSPLEVESLTLRLLFAQSISSANGKHQITTPPRRVLIVLFQEALFFPVFRRIMAMDLAKDTFFEVKAIQSGDEVTADEIIDWLRKYTFRAQRLGTTLERIGFLHLDAATYSVPAINSETFFWPTLFQFLRSEGLTSFFGLANSTPIRSVIGKETEYEVGVSEETHGADKTIRIDWHKNLLDNNIGGRGDPETGTFYLS